MTEGLLVAVAIHSPELRAKLLGYDGILLNDGQQLISRDDMRVITPVVYTIDLEATEACEIIINDQYDIHATLKLRLQDIVTDTAEVTLHAVRTGDNIRIGVILLVGFKLLRIDPNTAIGEVRQCPDIIRTLITRGID
jgi:hypothetical protein